MRYKMILLIYIVMILLGLAFWIRGITIVSKRKEIIKYAIINTVIFIIYSIAWFNHSEIITGHDEYGLGKLFGFPLILAIHSILIFIIIIITVKRTKN